MEIQQINETIGQKLYNLLQLSADNQYVQCPCQVIAVNGNYVDVLPIINDDEKNQEVYDVKIRHLESSTAYIFLGVHVGDRGVLRFFDRSIDNYSENGSEEYNLDDRMHNVNDGCFELGFIPDNEAYVYPTDKEFEIGLKNGSIKINTDGVGELLINGVDIKIQSNTKIVMDAPDIRTTGNFGVGTGYTGLVPCGMAVLLINDGIITGVI